MSTILYIVQVQRLSERLNITGGGEEAFWLDFILVVSVKNYRLVLCGELTSLLCEDFSRKVKPDYSYYCKRRADLKKRF